MHRIGVFLSANDGLSESFRTAAEQLGRWIGRTGRTLVFGGSSKGLMEVLAASAKAEGGHVVGVVPRVLEERGWVSGHLDECIATQGLADRKQALIDASDVLVCLPGGVGTLDEMFTALGDAAIGMQAKPVILYNVDGCWNSLLRFLSDLHSRRLLRTTVEDFVRVAASFEELTALLGAE